MYRKKKQKKLYDGADCLGLSLVSLSVISWGWPLLSLSVQLLSFLISSGATPSLSLSLLHLVLSLAAPDGLAPQRKDIAEYIPPLLLLTYYGSSSSMCAFLKR